jgi:squalene synthase HpnC
MTSVVIHNLAYWGPQQTLAPPSLAEAEAYCRRLATTHYENFPVVSWMLPKALQQPFCNLYAFCRWADDLGDEAGDPQRALELLDWWRSETERCYAGELRHPVFGALKPTIDRFAIPREPFLDLISAFVQDQTVREYDNFAQLADYCRRSANPVGRLVLLVCEQSTPQNIAWSDSICTGLQLANFWQDVARDSALGRIYLPREDYERFGLERGDFPLRVTTENFRDLLKFEVERARQFLINGLPLVEHLPGRLQVAIDLFARGGLRILERIERMHYNVWEMRPRVTKFDALGLLAASCVRYARRRLSSRNMVFRGTQSFRSPRPRCGGEG